MDYDRMIKELKTGFDALEAFPVRGYSSRAQINLAQEMILSVYNEICKAKKAEEHDEAAADVTAKVAE